jgi:hypothetical protein
MTGEGEKEMTDICTHIKKVCWLLFTYIIMCNHHIIYFVVYILLMTMICEINITWSIKY